MMAGSRMFRATPDAVNAEGQTLSTIPAALQALTRAVFPPVCCLCEAPGVLPDLDLCDVCTTLLPLNRPVNGVPMQELSLPHRALGSGSTLVRLLAPFHYLYPVDHLIRALKFRGERVYARVLGALLAHAHQASRQPAPDILIPIPLHAQRYRERGFNQAHEIATFAASALGLPVDPRSLVRHTATREQSGLSLAERKRNVRGTFAVVRAIQAQRVALVDDVLTTGSTALAAATALLKAGVPHVELWVVARVPLQAPARTRGATQRAYTYSSSMPTKMMRPT